MRDMVTAVSNKALRSAKASLTCSSRVHARVHAWKTVVAVAVNWMGRTPSQRLRLSSHHNLLLIYYIFICQLHLDEAGGKKTKQKTAVVRQKT